MKITAKPRNRDTGNTHNLTDQALNAAAITIDKDGSIVIGAVISSTGLSGEFNVSITLSNMEALLLAQRTLSAPLEAKLRKANINLG